MKIRLAKRGEEEYICIDVIVSNPLNEKLKAKIPFIADTGAVGCTIPGDLAERLGIEPRGEVEAVVADGRAVTVKMGYALLEVAGRRLYTWVMYGPGFEPLLGLDVMRILKIHVDVPAKDLLLPVRFVKIRKLHINLYPRGG